MGDVNKALATSRIADEMRNRGWTIFGYKADASDSMSDYYSPANWQGGVATHTTWPGVVMGMDVYSTHSSGKDQTTSQWLPAGACAACSGTGTEPSALTYEEALQNPAEGHKAKQRRAQGIRLIAGSEISRNDYHGDGRPKCDACRGRGHDLREEITVVCTWPTFQATPKGKSWHIEIGGTIAETGVGLSYCDSYNSGWERSVERMVNDIEAAAKRAHERHTRTTTAQAAAAAIGDTSMLPTEAIGHGFTIRVEYEPVGNGVKSIITTAPRLAKPDWLRLRDGFGVGYDRKSGVVSKWMFVTAQAVLDFLRPPTAEELAARNSVVRESELTEAAMAEAVSNPAYADPIAVAYAQPEPETVQAAPYTPPQNKPLVARVEARSHADGHSSEVGIIDGLSVQPPAVRAPQVWLLADADRFFRTGLSQGDTVRQIGNVLVLARPAASAPTTMLYMRRANADASPEIFDDYDRAVAEAERLSVNATPAEPTLAQTHLGEAVPVEAEAAAEGQATAIFMLITLPYDRAAVLPPNTKPLAKCGDFAIVKTSDLEVEALYEAMQHPAVHASGATLQYSAEFAQFEDAVAKAQQATFTRHNLASLTESRNARIAVYNPETDACAVNVYAETVTEAAPALAEAALLEQAAPPAEAFAMLLYNISLLESSEITELAGVKNAQAEGFQEQWVTWVRANPGAVDETVAGAFSRYQKFLHTPTPTSRYLAVLADAEPYLGFSARWDGEGLGRWRIVRVEQRDVEWQSGRLASGLKGSVTIHTDRAAAEAEMQMQHDLDTPRTRAEAVAITETPVAATEQPQAVSPWSATNPAWLSEQFSAKDWGDQAKKQRDLRVKQLRACGWDVTVKKVEVMDSLWFELRAKAPGFNGPIITRGGSTGPSTSCWVKPDNIGSIYHPKPITEPEAIAPVVTPAPAPAPTPAPAPAFTVTTLRGKRGKDAPDAVQWAMF